MRIVGGDWRGRRLASLGTGDAAAHLRPTSDRVREAIFNILINAHGDPVTGARVLDLFAGTGGLGLEALSRRAERAVFVDDGAKAGKLLRENIAVCGAGDRAEVMRRDVRRLGSAAQAFDLIFLDPPYGKGLGEVVLPVLRDGGWLTGGAVIVWEEGGAVEVPAGFEEIDERRYGDTQVHFLTVV